MNDVRLSLRMEEAEDLLKYLLEKLVSSGVKLRGSPFFLSAAALSNSQWFVQEDQCYAVDPHKHLANIAIASLQKEETKEVYKYIFEEVCKDKPELKAEVIKLVTSKENAEDVINCAVHYDVDVFAYVLNHFSTLPPIGGLGIKCSRNLPLLINKGLDVDFNDFQFIKQACRAGHVETVKILLAAGAKIEDSEFDRFARKSYAKGNECAEQDAFKEQYNAATRGEIEQLLANAEFGIRPNPADFGIKITPQLMEKRQDLANAYEEATKGSHTIWTARVAVENAAPKFASIG